jgi:hypothetical protein
MRRTAVCFVAFATLCLPLVTRADPASPAPPPPAEAEAQPPGPPPSTPPPAPVFTNPPAPVAQPIEVPPQAAPPAPAPRVPDGQWVFTQQYGWLWMPYDQAYTNVDDNAALAYEYVYYPRFGWRWVVAPWVLGFGIAPHWGVLGPVRFAWYAHPWFRIGTAHLRPHWGHTVGPHPGWRFGGRARGHGRR